MILGALGQELELKNQLLVKKKKMLLAFVSLRELEGF